MNQYRLLLLLLLLAAWSSGCTDKCKETRTYRRYTSATMTGRQVRDGVQIEFARSLAKPGKIYTKDGFLFINEQKAGIHVIDNTDPANPKFVSFLRIPGNGDIAIRNNVLYADSYMDLLVFDLTNLRDIKLLKRIPSVFTSGSFEGAYWSYNSQSDLLYDQNIDYVTETIQTNCEESVNPNRSIGIAFATDMSSAVPSTSPNTTNGVAGSMARFALYDKYLYTVSNYQMQLFNIATPTDPQVGNKIPLGWNIETIFPYKDKLFIGSQSGMYIYDNAYPEKPTQLSVFQHARVCDPVVVSGNTAYVTLRSGTTCQGFTNQLEVVDITSLTNPKLLKTYPMRNPHGLGIDFPNLFICEGAYGLKSFDASNPLTIDQNLRQYIEDINAYDVIPLNKSLLMIGQDGFYQYDYTNPRQLRLLSKIPVNRPIAL